MSQSESDGDSTGAYHESVDHKWKPSMCSNAIECDLFRGGEEGGRLENG